METHAAAILKPSHNYKIQWILIIWNFLGTSKKWLEKSGIKGITR